MNTSSTSSVNSKWTKCQFCKLVITTANLWRHVRTQHTNQPKIQCEKCKKTFKNKYSLREHVRMAHENKLQSSTSPGKIGSTSSSASHATASTATVVTVIKAEDIAKNTS